MRPLRTLAFLLATATAACAQSAPAAPRSPISADPAVDTANPPSMQSFGLPSHGVLLNALVYVAAGAGPHPVVILLHGFPGNEKNLDLAQAIRRAGWDVLYFDYRGSWGSPGAFSFEHSIEDTQAALAYMRDPANAAKLHADPKVMVLIGHSMGGMIAAYTTAHDPQVTAMGLISAADMAGRTKLPPGTSAEAKQQAQTKLAAALAREGIAPLAGCTPESLAAELMTHSADWDLAAQATGIGPRPVLIVTSDDGLAPANDALAAALEKFDEAKMQEVHIATDHSYSGKRIELEQTVLSGLAYVRK